MENNEKGCVDILEGLAPVQENALDEYLRAMTENVIPEIVRVVEERRLGAAKSRHWQLKC